MSNCNVQLGEGSGLKGLGELFFSVFLMSPVVIKHYQLSVTTCTITQVVD